MKSAGWLSCIRFAARCLFALLTASRNNQARIHPGSLSNMKPPRSLSPNMQWMCIAVLACMLGLPSIKIAAQQTAKQPNVVFLFADDQRADTIAALGNPHIKTPNLDELVRRGFVFRNAYCLGANVGAVCTPSRNMLMSGRAYFRWQGPQAQPEM